MSGDNEGTSCCASCGIAEVDDIKLKDCGDCDLVKYCSDECRKDHKSEHEEACEKRAAELRDELLFKQPESNHLGDCPICSLPLSLDLEKSGMYHCCSKVICNGCAIANEIREGEMRRELSCPFCRELVPETDEEADKRNMKRIEANDPVAMCLKGMEQCNRGDYLSALEYFTKAAELGYAQAHFRMAAMYYDGEGVQVDFGKGNHHFEEAAIGGHSIARYALGDYEKDHNGSIERAVKHWIIAATQGEDDAIKTLLGEFREGHVSKDVLAAALRAHKAAVDETKSAQREAAESCVDLSRIVGNK